MMISGVKGFASGRGSCANYGLLCDAGGLTDCSSIQGITEAPMRGGAFAVMVSSTLAVGKAKFRACCFSADSP